MRYVNLNNLVTAYLYFVAVKGGDVVKIGMAVDVPNRMRDLQVANHKELELLVAVEVPLHIERWLHGKLSEYRIRGEWFRLEGEVRSVVDAILIRGDQGMYSLFGRPAGLVEVQDDWQSSEFVMR